MGEVALVEKVVCGLWPLIGENFNHLSTLEENVKTLKKKMKALKVRETIIRGKLDVGKVNDAKEPNKEVQSWLEDVEKITSDVEKIKTEFGEDKKFLNGYIPNYCMRIELSRRAAKKIKEVEDLQKDIKERDEDLFADPKPDIGQQFFTTPLVCDATVGEIMERVWDYLTKDEIGILGVHGQAGTGKTAIMKHINNKLIKERNPFDKVIWVTVSSNLEQLQDAIAKQLDLDLSKFKDGRTRATKLSGNLKQRKFVLFLDDVWDVFSFETVGIPLLSGCKSILTTRRKPVCVGMECIELIEVDILSKETAWTLFKQTVGNDVEFTSEVEPLARSVAEKCACLPLAIVTVGQTMRKKDQIWYWRTALRDLESLVYKSMNDEVYPQLKFSYERLDDKVRECFLYCALYPQDHNIPSEELIDYWIADGLIDDCKDREGQMDRGHLVLEQLKDSSMLEYVGTFHGCEYVKMHGLFWEMAVNITHESNRFIVEAGDGSKKPGLFWEMAVNITHESNHFILEAGDGSKKPLEMKERSSTVERISLMNHRIKIHVDRPKCPKLSTLLFQKTRLSGDIPHSFFDHMHNLRVLDLSYTNIKYLPNSLSNMENLRALFLKYCRSLVRVPSLSRLRKLRVLDLKGAGIGEGMEEVANIRGEGILKGTGIGEGMEEVANIRGEGIMLVFLVLMNLLTKYCGWKLPARAMKAKGGVDIKDIISLTQLTSLTIHLEDSQGWTHYMRSGNWKSLESFHFTIGHLQLNESLERNFSVEIEGYNLVRQGSSRVFPDQTQFLCIIQGSMLSNLKDLKDLYIKECRDIESIDMLLKNTFHTMEKLCLLDLPLLRTVCKGIVPSGTLASLKVLFVSDCPMMEKALPLGLFQQLRNLETIRVVNCIQIKEIAAEDQQEEGEEIMEITEEGEEIQEIAEEDQEEEGITPTATDLTLQSLQELKFECLFNLNKICGRVLECKSLHTITVASCHKLEELPIRAPQLKFFYASNCNSLKNLSPLGQQNNLQNIEKICIRICEKIEVIVIAEDKEIAEPSNNLITLPNLKKLRLTDLPRLERISQRELVCKSLSSITVWECPLLKELPFSVDNIPPAFKKIEGEKKWWDALEWDDPETKIHFQRFFREIKEENEEKEDEQQKEQQMIGGKNEDDKMITPELGNLLLTW